MGFLEQITQMKNQGIPDQEIVSSLQEQGIISPKQLALLGALIVAARERKARESSLSMDSDGGYLSALSFRGGGGDSLKSFGGGGGLHTGVGGLAGRLGSIDKTFEPDPFASPIVYVIYPWGVAARENLQPDINAGVALANNVIQLGSR